MPVQPEFPQRLQSIERLLAEVEASANPSLRSVVQELIQLVMDLHSTGLERLIELIRSDGDDGERIIHRLGRDELVSSVLVLYGLHPMMIEERIGQALDKVRPRLRNHDAEVELLSIQDGAVRLKLHANGHGCGSTPQALKEVIEEAVYQAAPDITALAIEGGDEKHGFVPLEMLQGLAVPKGTL